MVEGRAIADSLGEFRHALESESHCQLLLLRERNVSSALWTAHIFGDSGGVDGDG